MINYELFNCLTEVPHIAGKIQKIRRAAVTPAAPCYGVLYRGFAYEFYQTDKNKQLVSWFWRERDIVIPTSPYSTIVFSKNAVLYEFDYRRTFGILREHEESRAEYSLIRARHNLQIAERISDIRYLSAFRNYVKLKQQIPQVFAHASEGTIASFLNIEVEQLRGFMQAVVGITSPKEKDMLMLHNWAPLFNNQTLKFQV